MLLFSPQCKCRSYSACITTNTQYWSEWRLGAFFLKKFHTGDYFHRDIIFLLLLLRHPHSLFSEGEWREQAELLLLLF